jgi:penicillin amidase
LGSISVLAPLFNVGPFAATGSREVINNMAFKYTGSVYYAVDHGPSTRRIVDFSDVEHSMSILPTGQSGNPFSPHYNDQADLFHQGKFRLMMMNWDEIKAQSTQLNLIPN